MVLVYFRGQSLSSVPTIVTVRPARCRKKREVLRSPLLCSIGCLSFYTVSMHIFAYFQSVQHTCHILSVWIQMYICILHAVILQVVWLNTLLHISEQHGSKQLDITAKRYLIIEQHGSKQLYPTTKRFWAVCAWVIKPHSYMYVSCKGFSNSNALLNVVEQ